MDEVDKVTSGNGVAAEIVAIADDWARAIAGNDAERTTDVFVLRNGRWQCVLSQITQAAAG
jgi:hypothetical protein